MRARQASLASRRPRIQTTCMPRAIRLAGVAAALTAWLAASGLAWDGLQLAAWANMARLNARTMSTDAAIRTAVTGAPCKHCLAVRAARETSDRGAPVSQPGKSVADLPLPADDRFTFLAPRAPWAPPGDLTAPSLPAEVPVPPPRGRVA